MFTVHACAYYSRNCLPESGAFSSLVSGSSVAHMPPISQLGSRPGPSIAAVNKFRTAEPPKEKRKNSSRNIMTRQETMLEYCQRCKWLPTKCSHRPLFKNAHDSLPRGPLTSSLFGTPNQMLNNLRPHLGDCQYMELIQPSE